MKKTITILSLFVLLGSSNAQQASDYFPSQTGFEWKYKEIPLDSASNPIPSLTYFTIDSFATIANYEGRLANIVLTKSGPLQTILFQPYLDSVFYHTTGTDGYEYFNIQSILPFLEQLDSSGVTPNFSFVDFFTSLQDWYPLYQFASSVNTEYTLRQIDTTIFIDPLNVPIRFKYLGKRLQDETIPTVLGNLDCKKFLLQWKVFAFTVVELLTLNDTVWIAPDNWIVQDIVPGQYVDISILPIDPFSLPGFETKLTDEIVSIESKEYLPTEFALEQNYPNPFNPTTTIKYQIPAQIHVTLKVYDVLGNEIATLVNEEKSAGTYETEFSAEGLTSGVYFYKLQSGGIIETKKMVLLR